MATTRDNLGRFIKGVRCLPIGFRHSEESKEKIRLKKLGKTYQGTIEASKKRTGEKHPRWVERVEQECKSCHEIFIKRITDKKEFCNKRCWYDYKDKPPSKAKGKPRYELRGKGNGSWIEDRTQLAKRQERGDSAYRDWRSKVKKRDKYRCRINNQDCSGNTIAHHILSWRDYPELRYQINNGITLCQAHHPRKRAEEEQFVPVLQELIGNHLN